MKKLRAPALLAVAAALSLGIAACGGDDDDDSDANGDTTEAVATSVALTGEQTVLVLDADTAGVLTELGVEVAPVEPAGAEGDGIAFPITGGEIDTETLAGTIDHSGGLVFSAGGTDVELTDFVVDTTAGTLTASTSDGASLPTLDLDLAAVEQSADGDAIVLTGITAALSADAAGALNDAFGIDALEGGIPIGDVTVTATG